MKKMFLDCKTLEAAFKRYYEGINPEYEASCSFEQKEYNTNDSDGFTVKTCPIECSLKLSRQSELFGRKVDIVETIKLEGEELEKTIKKIIGIYLSQYNYDLVVSSLWTKKNGFELWLDDKNNDKRKVLR